jgi:glutamine amidotransferase
MTDGERLFAFRLASDAKPPSLYLRHCGSGVILASEPLCEDEPGWRALPVGAVVTLDAQGCQVRGQAEAQAEFSLA